jgi:hypothetical protein
MKLVIAVTILAVAAFLTVAYATKESKAQAQPPNVFFGFLTGTPRIAAVAIDLGAPDANGQRVLRAYVCDGLGQPEGIAIWFRGAVEATPGAGVLSYNSIGGQEKLVITAMGERGVYGAFVDAQGATAHFVAYPAIDGAGIYQVTFDESLRYRGTSTDGSTLDAQATRDGTTSGKITLASGRELEFSVRSLALASPADLALHGLPQDFRRFTDVNQVPGEYTAVIAPGGSHWFGRSGSVQTARPGTFIIGLDKKVRGPVIFR